MALIKCIDCGKEVSDKAKVCPNCGCPIESSVAESSNKDEITGDGVVSSIEKEKPNEATTGINEKKQEKSNHIEYNIVLLAVTAILTSVAFYFGIEDTVAFGWFSLLAFSSALLNVIGCKNKLKTKRETIIQVIFAFAIILLIPSALAMLIALIYEPAIILIALLLVLIFFLASKIKPKR